MFFNQQYIFWVIVTIYSVSLSHNEKMTHRFGEEIWISHQNYIIKTDNTVNKTDNKYSNHRGGGR